MNKKQMAEFLARISSKVSKMKRTESEWVTHYLTFSARELREICASYGD